MTKEKNADLNSYACGPVLFLGNWTDKTLLYFFHVFNTHLSDNPYATKNIKRTYEIGIGRLSEHPERLGFEAGGHGICSDIMKKIDDLGKEINPEEWIAISKLMFDDKLYAEIEFTDYTMPEKNLYREKGRLLPFLNENGEYGLKFETIEKTKYAYTRQNFIELNVVNEEDFSLSIENISDHLERKYHLEFPSENYYEYPKISLKTQEKIKQALNKHPWTFDPEEILKDAGVSESI